MDTQATSQDPECGLILEALQMHLETIRTRLVSLTEHFQSQVDIPTLEICPLQLLTPSVSLVTNTSASKRETESHFSSATTHLSKRSRAGGRSSSVSTLTDASSSSTHTKCKPLSAQLSDWKPLHNYYKYAHLEVLQEHVQEQLHRQKEMDNKWKLKCRNRAARERRARLALKPRALKSEFKNDTLFLQKLQTSIFYKIVEAEYKMKKKGLLRSRVDHELFWNTMLSQDKFKRPSPPHPVSSTIEEEPDDLTNTWAITGMHETNIPADSSHVRSTDKFLAEIKLAVDANKPPKMHSLSDLITSTPSLLSEISEESKAAIVEVRRARDKIHRMTAHSKRNEYTAQLFMEKSDFIDFSFVFSEFCSQLDTQLDNILIKDLPKQLPRILPIRKHMRLPPISHPQEMERCVNSSAPDKSPSVSEPIPLSMSEVVSCGSVVVRSTKTSLWRNTMVSID
ncbi:hypothetical protein LOD99_4682 [Oopsacas minuta]|uniref:Uncharacterized protein n=1 Tax=Oopsacas minuta TaxID=111878 RepID=A0AAV7JTP6_9METZ|nr:hypothetical protein LOD99_4682 [Oopsacas minuta]